MKFNISYPITGQQKSFDIDDEKKVAIFYDRRIGAEVEGDTLGDDFKGYVLKITGGMDKDGFPMKQGILVKGRVRMLLKKGQTCFRPRREGERKRKSVRGCIVGADLSVISLRIVKKGEKDIAGLTNEAIPRRLGPKRANHIRKLYGLKKSDDVRRYVVRRTITKEGKKARTKAPKIQRLITAERLRRKRVYRRERVERVIRNQKALGEYLKMKADWKKKHAHHKGEEKKPAEVKPVPPAVEKKQAAPAKGGKPAPAAPAKTTGKTETKPAATKPAATKATTKK